jgi:hypothetical protein
MQGMPGIGADDIGADFCHGYGFRRHDDEERYFLIATLCFENVVDLRGI